MAGKQKPTCATCVYAHGGECRAEHTEFTESGQVRRVITFGPDIPPFTGVRLKHVYQFYCQGREYQAYPTTENDQ